MSTTQNILPPTGVLAPGAIRDLYTFQVYAKLLWSDPLWRFIPNLIPISAVETDIQGEGRAEFIYNFGEVKQLQDGAVGGYEPAFFRKHSDGKIVPLRDLFVAIRVTPHIVGMSAYCAWVGYMPAEQIDLGGIRPATYQNLPFADYPLPSGGQRFVAHGLEYLLSRRRVTVYNDAGTTYQGTAAVHTGEENGDGTTKVAAIGWQPSFNVRSPNGRHLLGNRSNDRIVKDSNFVYGGGASGDTEVSYGFSTDGQKWTWLQILEYVLFWSHTIGDSLSKPDFQIAATIPSVGEPTDEGHDYLNSIVDVIDQDDSDVLAIVRKILDPRRGVGGFLRPSHYNPSTLLPDGVILLETFSFTEKDITVGGQILPANLNVETVNIDGDSGNTTQPIDLRIAYASIDVDQSSVYDEIIVQAERMIVCFSAATAGMSVTPPVGPPFEDTNSLAYTRRLAVIRPAWASEQEAEYVAANDATRRYDKLTRVFNTFALAKTGEAGFDWITAGPLGTRKTLNPTFDANGRLVVPAAGEDETVGGFLNIGKGILRELPIPAPWDIDFESVDGAAMSIFAIVERFDLNGAATGKWDYANDPSSPGEIPTDVAGRMDASASIEPQDKDLEIRVRFAPAHLLAKNHWDTSKSVRIPVFDYDRMIITLAVESDTKPSVHIRPNYSRPGTKGRVLTIQVRDAECWYVAPGTVWYIDPATELPVNYPFPGLQRDDTQRLRDVAALAQRLYGQPRVSVRFARNGLDNVHSIGVMLEAVTKTTVAHLDYTDSNPGDPAKIVSVVTQRTFDFKRKTVEIVTSQLHIDPLTIGSQV